MRWFVEVSRVGDSTLAERYCVEAKAWQAALQETRKLRGDSGPLSKFSIELLDDGYRAVDPVQKIRYLVNQAPGDAPLVMPQVNGTSYGALASTPPGAAGPSSPPAAAAASVAPAAPVAVSRPAPAAPVASVAPAVAVASVAPAAAVASVAPAAAVASVAASLAPVAAAAAPASAASIAPSAASAAALTAKKVLGVSLAPTSNAVASVPPANSTAAAAPRPSPRRSAANKGAAKGNAVEAKGVESAAPAAPADPAPVAPEPVVAPAPAPTANVVPAVTVAVAAKPPAPGVPEFSVFSSRVQEPSPDAPIAYREMACVVAPGTSREAIEALLRDQLAAARAAFAGRPPGQLIQIAIFDHVFEERPQRAPLGTVAWKDWRGEPVLGYPAFGESAPPTTASLPPAPIIAVAATALSGASPEPTTQSPPQAPAVAAPPSDAATTAPALAAAATPAAVAAAVPQSASDEAEQPVLLRRPASRPDSDPGSRPRMAAARRRAGEDLISELFESMHELHFARDLPVGADFVLGVLEQVIPCEAVLIQVFDINTRNFVVVRGRGSGASRAVLHRTPDNDPLTAEIMRRDTARAYRPEGDARFSSGRWGVVGLSLRQVLCGAVRQGGRYLGMIELANPLGDAPFHETEINALDYICEQFADFVASRPVVLDPDVILAR